MELTFDGLREVLDTEIEKLGRLGHLLNYDGQERLRGYRKIQEEANFCTCAKSLLFAIGKGLLTDSEMDAARAAVRAIERVAAAEVEEAQSCG